jgi:hypothetical protein
MSARASFRRKVILPVTVIKHGGQEKQLAHTLDLTANSARLGGLTAALEPGETIEVQRGAVKSKFQVVWMGSAGGAMAGQAGIHGLEPNKCIWNVDLPDDETDTKVDAQGLRKAGAPVRTANQFPGERRWHPRYVCGGSVAVKTAGTSFAINGEAKDISQGGVYVELSAPLPVGSKVILSLSVENIRFEAAGVVRTSYPLLGMGVCFQNLSPQDAEKLAVAVERAKRRAPAQQEYASLTDAVSETGSEVTSEPDAQSLEKNPAQALLNLCRKAAEDLDRWQSTCSPAEIEEMKLVIHELDKKLAPKPVEGLID